MKYSVQFKDGKLPAHKGKWKHVRNFQSPAPRLFSTRAEANEWARDLKNHGYKVRVIRRFSK